MNKKKSTANRRHFLKATLAAGVAPCFVPAHVLGAEGKTAPSNKITLGVLGVGDRGRQDMSEFLGLDSVRVTTVCDVNQRNIAKAHQRIAKYYGQSDVKVVSEFRELNADPSIDAVQMTLPVHWHSIPAVDAIVKGKHIHYEKPMAMSFEEARRVRSAVRQKGVVFQFGTQQRSDVKFRWACELARNGRLGKLKRIDVVVPGGRQSELFPEQPVPDYVDWNRWVGPAPMSPFNEKKLIRGYHERMSNFSLGMISCWGIHHLDIAQWGNDTDNTGPRSVEGTGVYPESGSCDTLLNWQVQFEFDRAAPVTFSAPGNENMPQGVRFIGDSASVFVRRGLIKADDDDLLRDPQNQVNTMPVKLPVSDHHERNFVEAIKNASRAICDIETAVRSDTMCQIAYIAVNQGRELTWDPQAERFVNDDVANAMLQPRPFRGDWKLQDVKG